jgi:hypothetical protein
MIFNSDNNGFHSRKCKSSVTVRKGNIYGQWKDQIIWNPIRTYQTQQRIRRYCQEGERLYSGQFDQGSLIYNSSCVNSIVIINPNIWTAIR